MLKWVLIVTIFIATSAMGYNTTLYCVEFRTNIDLGGGGDSNEVHVIFTNIFGEDCLGCFVLLNVTSFFHLSVKIAFWE